MDKEEFRIKLEEINSLVEKKDYKGAMEIVDSIDWRRVKNVRTLCIVGEIYAANKRYEESKEIFLLAYHRSPIGKTILYRLIEVSLRMGDLNEAQEFYDEFLEVAPNDNTKYILNYKLLSEKKAPLDEQIAVLEEYKEHEYTERWTYELAKLYYKAGEKEKCVETCDDLILWFSEGKYVTKALELKMQMGILTEAEKRQFEEELTPKLKTKEESESRKDEEKEEEYEETESEIESIPLPKENIENPNILEATGMFQEKIARGIKDIFSGKRKEEPLNFDEEDEKEEKEEKEEPQPEPEEENIENVRDNPVDIQDIQDVPELEPEVISAYEPEEEKKPEEMKIPEAIRIPEPMKAPEAVISPAFVPTQEEIDAAMEADMMNKMLAEEEKNNCEAAELTEEEAKDLGITKNFDFNLEDTILAAASAQGIEVPEETEPVGVEEAELEETDFEITESEIAKTAAEEKTDEKTDEAEISELEPEEMQSQIEMEESVLEEEVIPEDNRDFVDLESKILDSFEQEEKEEIKPEEKQFSEEELLEQFIDNMNPEPEKNPLYLIPREMKLDETEKKLFTYFSAIPGIPEQLAEALADVQMSASEKTSKTGNVIIMGGLETGKTRLSQGFILAACRELNMEAAKTATLTGSQLNDREPAEVVDKLAGGFLVIERAGQMNAETIEKLGQAMEFRTDGLTVIIEDEKIDMRKLIAKYPKFARKFTSMINIPVFTNDELVTFAKIYTTENGYVMDQMGILALYNLIGDNQKEDEPMTIGKVKEMLDNAISRAESGTRKFKRNLSKKRMDEEGRVILYEKDFG